MFFITCVIKKCGSMFSFILEAIKRYKEAAIPPVMGGAKAMIQQLAEEERKIIQMNKASPPKTYTMEREKENIADLFSHCVSNDFYKDAYQFIKTG